MGFCYEFAVYPDPQYFRRIGFIFVFIRAALLSTGGSPIFATVFVLLHTSHVSELGRESPSSYDCMSYVYM